MRLLNHTLLYLSGALFLIIGVWAVVFYFSMLDEIYDSIDDGLDNYKVLIIQKAETDNTVLSKAVFDESNYQVKKINEESALKFHENYSDTMMYMENEKKLEPVRLLSTVFSLDNGNCYQLKVISSMVEEDDLIKDLLYHIFYLYAAIILSVVIINNFLLKKVWKPFYQLILQLNTFNLKTAASITRPSTHVMEFNALNDSVMALINKNVEIYNSQKHFIENAAHELQTPLAISINKLELMLEETAFTEQQTQSLAEVIRNLERLTRLNKSLLLLSKIENKQFTRETPIEFNGIIKQQLTDFTELLEYKSIKTKVKETGVFTHSLNRDIAVILVTNLLKNAIVHNVPQGEIVIGISPGQLSFSNTGKQEPLDQEKMFGRFYKASDRSGSTGLGLAIVKTICDNYGLHIHYSFDGRHMITLSK